MTSICSLLSLLKYTKSKKPKPRSKLVTESLSHTPILENMNYRDGKMIKISNSSDRYSSRKIEVQLREKTKINFIKTGVKNASGRSQKVHSEVREQDPRRLREMRAPRTHDHVPRDT